MSGGTMSNPLLWAVALALLGALTSLLAWRCFRPRRVGDEPRCRRCNYDLRGRTSDSAVCSECGADLSLTTAIAIGRRSRRPIVAIVCQVLAIALLAASVRMGIAWGKDFNWLPYQPFSWVFAAAKSPGVNGPAMNELFDRVANHRLTEAQQAQVIRAAVAEQGGRGPWENRWAWMLEAMHNDGRLPEAEWHRYVDSLVTLDLNLPLLLRLGCRPTLSVRPTFNDRIGGVKVEGSWRITALYLDGRRLETLNTGDFSRQAGSSSSGSSSGSAWIASTQGVKTVTATVEIETSTNLGPAAATRPSDHWRRSVTLTRRCNVVPQQELSWEQAHSDTHNMPKAIDATARRTSDGAELTLLPHRPPYQIVADVSLCKTDGTAIDIPAFIVSFRTNSDENWSISLPRDCPEAFDVILTPVKKMPKSECDPLPVWPLPILIRDVHITAPVKPSNR